MHEYETRAPRCGPRSPPWSVGCLFYVKHPLVVADDVKCGRIFVPMNERAEREAVA